MPKGYPKDPTTAKKRGIKPGGAAVERRPHVPTIARPVRAKRCMGTNGYTGEQCARYAILGGDYCYVHGGNLPQSKSKAAEIIAEARRYLLGLTPMAIAAFEDILANPYSKDSDKIKAAENVLDRVGIAKVQQVEVTGGITVDVDNMIESLIERALEPAVIDVEGEEIDG